MEISFDPRKRTTTLRERGLDFLEAAIVFDGRTKTAVDDRRSYGETRFLTYGWLRDEAVAIVWTERERTCRIISMRRMHEWEIKHVGLD